MRRQQQQGVALIVTLILLAVITFTAITFLILSRREKGAVVTSTSQRLAQQAAETGVARMQAEIISSILQSSNRFNYGFGVTRSYVNPNGFISGSDSPTNVNYEYMEDGSPLGDGDDWNQNIANLFYSPRVPVFVNVNDSPTDPPNYDFRFYLDLNRNGRFETNGPITVQDQNGNPVLNPQGNPVQMNAVGDPEWVGVLEHPDVPHGPTNPFVARYASVVVPTGKTLDLNTVHNQALGAETNPNDSFQNYRRNMGVGTWEMNLAAFLVDLNTNYWTAPDDPAGLNRYLYPDPWDGAAPPLRGRAFEDADRLIAYRYATDYRQLRPLDRVFAGSPPQLLLTDGIDSYGSGDGDIGFLTNTWVRRDADDIRPKGIRLEWPGDDNPQHYASPSDFFDLNKTAIGVTAADINNGNTFSQRLLDAGQGASTYDRYTFYRLLSQLGTEGGFERADKVHLNYDNVNPYNASRRLDEANGVVSATNQMPWQPRAFFKVAADRLLREYFEGHFERNLGRGNVRSGRVLLSERIPVMVRDVNEAGETNNVFVYPPSMHRLLQLAANIYDASTNDTSKLAQNSTNIVFPSVFKPVFTFLSDTNVVANPGVYVTDWEEIDTVRSGRGASDPVFGRWGGGYRTLYDLENPSLYRLLERSKRIPPDANVYGVPWVIGVKKGLPNFNELAIQTTSDLTRKLQVDKDREDLSQLFVVGVSNLVAVEAWNSYANPFPGEIEIDVQHDLRSSLALTNRFQNGRALGQRLQDEDRKRLPNQKPRLTPTRVWTNIVASQWEGRGPVNNPNKLSFKIPFYQAFTNFPVAAVKRDGAMEAFTKDAWLRAPSTKSSGLPVMDIWLRSTNYMQVFMLATDRNGQKRVIDYVHLRIVSENDFGEVLRASVRRGRERSPRVLRGLWNDNWARETDLPRGADVLSKVLAGGRGVSQGVLFQLDIATGVEQVNDDVWADYGLTESRQTKEQAIADFKAFLAGQNRTYEGFQGIYEPDTRVMQVPYSPGYRIVEYQTWQANDPLVHYTAADLNFTRQNDQEPNRESPLQTVQTLKDKNIGKLNERYEPWGGQEASRADYNPALKDPGVRFSDDWQFPTNKFPNVGWLGRVHRGTPWQTVYMKSTDVMDQNSAQQGGDDGWEEWTGYTDRSERRRVLPRADRKLFDLFTAGFNQNATAGQLSVNQDGLAAWSAVLSGVITFTNPAPRRIRPHVIQPAGVANLNSGVGRIVEGIRRERQRRGDRNRLVHANGVFEYTGDVLATPELTFDSPFLDPDVTVRYAGLSDAVYERIPQQIMGLLRNDDPRFVIYSYGQALKPAPRSLISSGDFFGMCTNYQIMAEAATRTVVRVEGSTNDLRVVVESFGVLPGD